MDSLKFSNRFPYPQLNSYEGLIGKTPVASKSTFIGIEVEAEGVKGHINPWQVPGSWVMKEDGSLKEKGLEFVTVPIRFRYIEVELNRLFGVIPKADFSPRTSIHVHMNARDFTEQELFKFLILYLIFERRMYKASGDRWNNNFCMPVQSNQGLVAQTMKRLIHGGYDYYDWCKYYGLNILPLCGEEGANNRIGTVEFRHMAGTNSIPKIMNWCNLIIRLKIAAKSIPLETLIDMLKGGHVHTSLFAHRVFKEWIALIWDGQAETIREIKDGALAAKICLNLAGFLDKDTI